MVWRSRPLSGWPTPPAGSWLSIRDTHQPNTAAGDLQVVLRNMRWRMADGYALLLIGGIALAVCVTRFS